MWGRKSDRSNGSMDTRWKSRTPGSKERAYTRRKTASQILPFSSGYPIRIRFQQIQNNRAHCGRFKGRTTPKPHSIPQQEEITFPREEPREQANLLEEVNLSGRTEEPRTVLISKELTGTIRAAVIDTLRNNRDVFTWNYDEMPGLDPLLVTHKLGVELAQKSNGTIRCCVDYRDLNKACPKDEFPLPNIDILVDATAGHEMFSFMDGFSGYNQIRMAPEDAEKTAFRTPFGNFHYVVMPFGLKNAGATYQRAMTAIFHDMIHDIVKDYVDDLVVKSRRATNHVSHLKRVFDRCRKYKLKMNPKKCAFAVSMGKFLGVVVHREGISAMRQRLRQ
ncbi:hypothetical protein UlMin_045351 [Ulmus minor]